MASIDSKGAHGATCDECGAPLVGAERPRGGGELRCACGCLLARALPGGLELKCRRCKRAVVVPGRFVLPES